MAVQLNPAMARRIEVWKIGDLTPYDKNPRTHSEEQTKQIAASIAEFGFVSPILVDKEAGIIAGHGRWAAAKELGMEEVPVVVLDHLTPKQKKAYVIADNQIALNAGWDESLRAQEVASLSLADFNLELLGFDDEMMDNLLDPEDIDKPMQPVEGAEEYDEDEFDKFEHKCPRCGFEFDE